MSLGEAILFPSMSVHVDRIAPDPLRGAYFGATVLYDLGFAAAPIGGGIILDYYGGSWLFLYCALIALVVFALYQVMENLSRTGLAGDNQKQVSKG